MDFREKLVNHMKNKNKKINQFTAKVSILSVFDLLSVCCNRNFPASGAYCSDRGN